MNPISIKGTKFFIETNAGGEKHLCVLGEKEGFEGQEEFNTLKCKLNPHNANALRSRISWLSPQHLGMVTSFGFGDRLGLATPGHIAAVRNTGVAPIFAQQSVRENRRTGRNPQIVLDDAMWSIFEMGWKDPWGADADHVKEIEDMDAFIAAGYSFYTIDPNFYVDDNAHTDTIQALSEKVPLLPWEKLETDLISVNHKYLAGPIPLGEKLMIKFSEQELIQALVKYGHALAHVKMLSDHLGSRLNSYDLEVSVDETDTPTTVKEHFFIASELRRLKVPFVSLAPKFVGSFEKGVDYIGNLKEFDNVLRGHVAVMQVIGDYKLSIHTGSDKFSIYPIIGQLTGNQVHVKTAGTSYLEALKVLAIVDVVLFQRVYAYSYEHFETDRASYHLSGKLNRTPHPNEISDVDLFDLFNNFDVRQVLHVTYGSVLKKFGDQIKSYIIQNSDMYQDLLNLHFRRHLCAFSKKK
jgi:hypothetical protein